MSGVVYIVIPPYRIVVLPRDTILDVTLDHDITVDVIREGSHVKVIVPGHFFTNDIVKWTLMCDLTFNEIDHDITWEYKSDVLWTRTLGRPTRSAEQIDGIASPMSDETQRDSK